MANSVSAVLTDIIIDSIYNRILEGLQFDLAFMATCIDDFFKIIPNDEIY